MLYLATCSESGRLALLLFAGLNHHRSLRTGWKVADVWLIDFTDVPTDVHNPLVLIPDRLASTRHVTPTWQRHTQICFLSSFYLGVTVAPPRLHWEHGNFLSIKHNSTAIMFMTARSLQERQPVVAVTAEKNWWFCSVCAGQQVRTCQNRLKVDYPEAGVRKKENLLVGKNKFGLILTESTFVFFEGSLLSELVNYKVSHSRESQTCYFRCQAVKTTLIRETREQQLATTNDRCKTKTRK